MQDEEIVALYWNRSEDAIAATTEKYGAYCFAIANRILGSGEDAEECVNEALLGAWNSIPPHKPQVLSAFLGKITRRTALKRRQKEQALRRGGGEPALALEELAECLPSRQNVEQELESAHASAVVNAFVRSLPPTERRVFVCRYWYLDSVEEISNRFGFSQSKVKSMLLRTRKKLKRHLIKEGIVE